MGGAGNRGRDGGQAGCPGAAAASPRGPWTDLPGSKHFLTISGTGQEGRAEPVEQSSAPGGGKCVCVCVRPHPSSFHPRWHPHPSVTHPHRSRSRPHRAARPPRSPRATHRGPGAAAPRRTAKGERGWAGPGKPRPRRCCASPKERCRRRARTALINTCRCLLLPGRQERSTAGPPGCKHGLCPAAKLLSVRC